MTNVIDPQFYPYFLVFFAVLMPLLLSFRMFPVIIYLVITKNLMDEPGDRSAHINRTPTLGGLGIFVAFTIPIIVLGLGSNFSQLDLLKLLSVISGGILLLFAGLKDDLVGLAPKKKIMVQAVAAMIVILFTDVRIQSLYGLFGVGELPYLVSVALTLMAFVFVINAINLIDGVDGLAGTFSIIASLAYGLFFIVNGYYLSALVSFVIIGALLGFLRYNFSKTRKIFMGDSGSMFIGFLLVYQAICFLTCNTEIGTLYTFANGPILFLATLSFPIIDTLRVFCIRIKQKRSPFSADRNHIHHRLLDLGFAPKQICAIIGLANILVIGCAFMMGDLQITLQLVLIMAVILTVYLSPWLLVLDKDISLRLEKKIADNAHLPVGTMEALDIHTEQQYNDMLEKYNLRGYMQDTGKAQSMEERISLLEKLMAKRLDVFKKLKKTE
ncbi:MraY family glycosyltransferase [Sediminicola sp. 1XM1-17]|uniref:MraY family glycosyltransferase n=1 Tax=Sediminicola sp. 1XM1-17 TaxID=3127702 RepID=UPI003077BE05